MREKPVADMSGTILLLVGGGLVLVGLAIAGGGRKQTVRIGNTGFSVFGRVTQTFHSVGTAINGERPRTARDWIGWGLSAAGLIVGLVGLVGLVTG